MKDMCIKMDKLHDDTPMHRIVKQVCGIKKYKKHNVLVDRNYTMLTLKTDILAEWNSYYIEDTFQENRREPNINVRGDNSPTIIKSSIVNAIKSSKDVKSSSPDEIHTE